MAKEKAVSNEAIIAAIISNGSFEKAAEACGISSRTIRDRMQERDFQADYTAARVEIVRGAVANLDNKLAAAVNTIAEIMENPDNNPAVRLQAAQTILNNATKLADKLAEDEAAARRADKAVKDPLLDLFKDM